jgi:small subunit ribosomal protein S25e
MGGGKKNKSLTQMTKTKAPKESKQKDKPEIQTSTKKNLGIVMPDVNNKKVVAELKGLKVLTPSVVAAKYNIRVSLAKTFLKELEKRKIVEYLSGGKNLKIYKVAIE